MSNNVKKSVWLIGPGNIGRDYVKVLKEFDLDMKLLPRQFGMMDMVRKQLFHWHPDCFWEDTLTNLYNSGWVYQFNAIPPSEIGRDRTYWMKRVYEELYK